MQFIATKCVGDGQGLAAIKLVNSRRGNDERFKLLELKLRWVAVAVLMY